MTNLYVWLVTEKTWREKMEVLIRIILGIVVFSMSFVSTYGFLGGLGVYHLTDGDVGGIVLLMFMMLSTLLAVTLIITWEGQGERAKKTTQEEL